MASRRGFRSFLGSIVSVFAVTAYGCATTDVSSPKEASAEPEIVTTITGPNTPVEIVTDAGYSLIPTNFSGLPAWQSTNFSSARLSFLASCKKWSKQDTEKQLSKSAPYGGIISDWMGACLGLKAVVEPDAIADVFQAEFTPYLIKPKNASSKLTGYFEPELEAKYSPQGKFTKSVPGIPEDLVRVDPSKFEKKFSSGKVWGRVKDGELELYPDRKDIIDDPKKALGFVTPGELFYLQIQGSGRIKFPDGRVIRAAFAAHNHKAFVSIARHLIDSGQIQPHQAGMGSILKWMDEVGPIKAQDAMNVNPRYVWFTPQELLDPNKGPNGAQGVALTPMASMAVDPRYHPYGAPIFIDTRIPSEPGDWKGTEFSSLVIAQDTGGAIKGILRGDLFFGWGHKAGGRAASMNHDVDMWVLLPKRLAEKMADAQIRKNSEMSNG